MLENYTFAVEKQPILHDNNPSGFCKVVDTDKNRVLSVVSDNYLLIPNREVVERVTNEFDNVEFMPNLSFANGKVFNMQFFIKGTELEVSKGDIVGAMLRVQNSYDTTRALSVSADALRLVCMNGMKVGVGVYDLKTRHYGERAIGDILNDAIDSVKASLDNSFKEIIGLLKQMRKTKFDIEKRTKFVKSIINHKNYISEMIIAQMVEDNPKTVYDLYNTVTYVATHRLDRDKATTVQFEETITKEIKSLI